MPDTVETHAAIDLQGLRYAWPRQPVLIDIESFTVNAQETVMLQGPSGSGKSTLLGLVTGIIDGATGTCRILGHDMTTLSGAARDRVRADSIGYIFQNFNLVPYLSVLDNVLLPCRLSPARAAAAGPDRTGRARQLLDALGLDKRIAAGSVSALSVGQQQRVAAARALIGAPALIIADEPTSALDEERKNDFLRLLLGEAEKAGSAVLFVTHDRTLGDHFMRQVSLPDINRQAQPAQEA